MPINMDTSRHCAKVGGDTEGQMKFSLLVGMQVEVVEILLASGPKPVRGGGEKHGRFCCARSQ